MVSFHSVLVVPFLKVMKAFSKRFNVKVALC